MNGSGATCVKVTVSLRTGIVDVHESPEGVYFYPCDQGFTVVTGKYYKAYNNMNLVSGIALEHKHPLTAA